MIVQQYNTYKEAYRKKAEITVFLTLLMTILCTLLMTVIYAVRVQAIKIQSEALLDLAIKSAFSEYNKTLYEKYDLLFVDTSYHGANGGDADFCNHVEAYINANLSSETNSNLYKVSVKNINVKSSVYADENGYECLLRQILEYEKASGNYDDDSELVEYYAMEKFDESFIEMFDKCSSLDDKIHLIAEEIEKNMREDYSLDFSFDNLLMSASVEAYFVSDYGCGSKAISEYSII